MSDAACLTAAADATQGLPTRTDAGQARAAPQRARLATVSAPQRRPTDTARRHDGNVRRDSLARAARGESCALMWGRFVAFACLLCEFDVHVR